MTIQQLIQQIAGKKRYINLLTDWGFKTIFMKEQNKKFLLAFLNQVLKGDEVIESVEFQNPVYPGETQDSRAAIIDVLCKTDKGTHVLVELQRVVQKHIKDRLLYYSTFPVQQQAIKGVWDFALNKVYTIGILDFIADSNTPHYFGKHMIVNLENQKIWSDKLTFITIELPKLQKEWSECSSELEKWVYLLKNLQNMSQMSPKMREPIFLELLETCEKGKFEETEWTQYEDSVMAYADLKNYTDYAHEQGHEEGFAKGIEQGIEQGIAQGERNAQRKVAENLQKQGLSEEKIAEILGLSLDELKELFQ